MKNAALILNAVLLVLVGVLFYLHFSDRKKEISKVEGVKTAAVSDNQFKIGYFEWDSLENNADLCKQIKEEINQLDDRNEKAKQRLRQMYQNKVNSYSRNMSQTESETATKDIQKMEMDIRNQMQSLDEELQAFSYRKQQELKNKIEEYLKEYNKSRGYSFIMAYEPVNQGLLYYRDSVYNITNDLIKGLNQKYSKKVK
ncbi:MAG: OmpH family outer membrane protein [Flavisolibacter sp.]